ncbi:hypothetical protein EHS25_001270 [Saitozyma podzolica]|uniref:Uncharacterized protein n=1 Tax=Saitozyma podzolica TaxID=1890683 RepID=A0A427YHW1_9TREE|nr:hypothetical protein EHS25_001270 [Saitozyma podzolica]
MVSCSPSPAHVPGRLPFPKRLKTRHEDGSVRNLSASGASEAPGGSVKDKDAEEAARVLLGLRDTRLTPSASVSPPPEKRSNTPNRPLSYTLTTQAPILFDSRPSFLFNRPVAPPLPLPPPGWVRLEPAPLPASSASLAPISRTPRPAPVYASPWVAGHTFNRPTTPPPSPSYAPAQFIYLSRTAPNRPLQSLRPLRALPLRALRSRIPQTTTCGTTPGDQW